MARFVPPPARFVPPPVENFDSMRFDQKKALRSPPPLAEARAAHTTATGCAADDTWEENLGVLLHVLPRGADGSVRSRTHDDVVVTAEGPGGEVPPPCPSFCFLPCVRVCERSITKK